MPRSATIFSFNLPLFRTANGKTEGRENATAFYTSLSSVMLDGRIRILRHDDYRSFALPTNLFGDCSEMLPFPCIRGPAVDHQYCSVSVRQGEHRLPYSLGQLSGVSTISEALYFNADRALDRMFDDDVKAVITAKHVHVWTAILTTERFPGSIGAPIALRVRGQTVAGRVLFDLGHELDQSRPHIGLESRFVLVRLGVAGLGKVLSECDIEIINSRICHR